MSRTALFRYVQVAAGVAGGLTVSNFVSTHIPGNLYVEKDITYPIWSAEKKPFNFGESSPFQITKHVSKYILHDSIILGCSLCKSIPYGVIFPITIADFIYEFKYDRHWRKYFNLGYYASPGGKSIIKNACENPLIIPYIKSYIASIGGEEVFRKIVDKRMYSAEFLGFCAEFMSAPSEPSEIMIEACERIDKWIYNDQSPLEYYKEFGIPYFNDEDVHCNLLFRSSLYNAFVDVVSSGEHVKRTLFYRSVTMEALYGKTT